MPGTDCDKYTPKLLWERGKDEAATQAFSCQSFVTDPPKDITAPPPPNEAHVAQPRAALPQQSHEWDAGVIHTEKNEISAEYLSVISPSFVPDSKSKKFESKDTINFNTFSALKTQIQNESSEFELSLSPASVVAVPKAKASASARSSKKKIRKRQCVNRYAGIPNSIPDWNCDAYLPTLEQIVYHIEEEGTVLDSSKFAVYYTGFPNDIDMDDLIAWIIVWLRAYFNYSQPGGYKRDLWYWYWDLVDPKPSSNSWSVTSCGMGSNSTNLHSGTSHKTPSSGLICPMTYPSLMTLMIQMRNSSVTMLWTYGTIVSVKASRHLSQEL